jgi:hypothetical protein
VDPRTVSDFYVLGRDDRPIGRSEKRIRALSRPKRSRGSLGVGVVVWCGLEQCWIGQGDAGWHIADPCRHNGDTQNSFWTSLPDATDRHRPAARAHEPPNCFGSMHAAVEGQSCRHLSASATAPARRAASTPAYRPEQRARQDGIGPPNLCFIRTSPDALSTAARLPACRSRRKSPTH